MHRNPNSLSIINYYYYFVNDVILCVVVVFIFCFYVCQHQSPSASSIFIKRLSSINKKKYFNVQNRKKNKDFCCNHEFFLIYSVKKSFIFFKFYFLSILLYFLFTILNFLLYFLLIITVITITIIIRLVLHDRKIL